MPFRPRVAPSRLCAGRLRLKLVLSFGICANTSRLLKRTVRNTTPGHQSRVLPCENLTVLALAHAASQFLYLLLVRAARCGALSLRLGRLRLLACRALRLLAFHFIGNLLRIHAFVQFSGFSIVRYGMSPSRLKQMEEKSDSDQSFSNGTFITG